MSTANGWEKWADWVGEQHREVFAWICDRARVAPGMTVLDLCSGTGLPALDIARRVGSSGRAIATDIAADMLAGCERRAKKAGVTLEIRELDMHDLHAFADGSIDAVTCAFGLMFGKDPAAVLTEVRRVLKPGGRVAVAVWDEPAKNAYFTTMFSSLGQVVDMPAPPPNAPGPFALSAPGVLERAFHSAGFTDVSIESVATPFSFDSLDQHFEVACDLAPPVKKAVASMPPASVTRLRELLATALAPYRDGARYRIPATPLCATAAK